MDPKAQTEKGGAPQLDVSAEELTALFDAHAQDPAAAARRLGLLISKALRSKSFKPPLLPEVALQLSEMAGQPNIRIEKVEQVVARDPTIAARVVAVANSAYYSRGTSIRSLRAAIMRLGLAVVRDVAFQVVAQTRIFRVPVYSDRVRSLFESAQAAGILARETCVRLRSESELAYLCGLLHDIGEAIILSIVADLWTAEGLPVPRLDDLWDVTRTYHAQTGALTCGMWGLPELISDAVMHHHYPSRSQFPAQMASVVAITDVLLAHGGIGVDTRKVNPMEEPLFYTVNLAPTDVEALLRTAESLGADRGTWTSSGAD